MAYHVYILFSRKLNRFYVGMTNNLDRRLEQHNNGKSTFTSQGKPWTLLWSTTKDSFRRAEALEFKIKNLTRLRKLKFIKNIQMEFKSLYCSKV